MIEMNQKKIELIIEENSGIVRVKEPITVGVPLPKGLLSDKNRLSLVDDKDNPIPLQAETLAKWPDQSIKWILLDLMADCHEHSTKSFYLNIADQAVQNINNDIIEIEDSGSSLIIKTGKTVFSIDKIKFIPFKSVIIDGDELLDSHNTSVVLKDKDGKDFSPVVKNAVVETSGPIRSTIKLEGDFKSVDGNLFCSFFSRITFYAGKSMVKINFTIRNPRAAKHPGGLWDLGDPGSVFFKDLSICISMKSTSQRDIRWKTQLNSPINSTNSNYLIIYQDSSGGENWDSPNHVNRYGKVTNSFRGYRVTTDVLLEEGYRATPMITVSSNRKSITATIQKFWQNFPKAIEADKNILKLKLFPQQYNDLFELQGGEQKTHTIYLQFDTDAVSPVNLEWVHEPLVCRNTPKWYALTMAAGYMSPECREKNIEYCKLVDNVISGKDSFFNLRERIDEYGWRNFGDVYASHEVVFYKEELFPFVSHYNNQYDVINGCFLQFAMTGDKRWFQLMSDLAQHVMDIDIYHTKGDRPAYNSGYFWHTDHFMHAKTSTHRSFSRKNSRISGLKSYGGGPSPEHCYTTGLTHYYYLTGDIMTKETVIELADWIINADNIEMSLQGVLRKGKQKLLSLFNRYAHAPGRGQANSINTLLDAFVLTEDRKYLLKAESILKKFISPSDDIDKLNQQEIELRWFYLIFLQSVGKYLDIKDNMIERDEMFFYAKESLLHHAKWMLKNEVPYKELFHIVEIPSSTWSAQDIRKSVIFDYAYKYCEKHLRNEFRTKAEYFFNKAIEDIMSFDDETRTFVRPLTVLMHYGVMHTYFQSMNSNI